jgi:hypothetical protein
MQEENTSMEERILRVMRTVLIDVVKDTTTEPGLKHPLSDKTIENIRNALDLITARQKELADEQGTSWDMRPRYPDQPKDSVVVSIDSIKGRKDKDDK